MKRIELIRFDVFVSNNYHRPALKKPDIMATSKLKAEREAKILYGNKAFVIEPYDPYWLEKKHEKQKQKK